jgi:flagellar operon protein
VSVNGIDGVGRSRPAAVDAIPGAPRTGGPAFADVLAARIGRGLALSGHAKDRIERREIPFDGLVAARLEAAVDRAAAKGGRESLVLVDDTAFVVSVRNRTVITAVDRARMRDQVFTNIDSAVIG